MGNKIMPIHKQKKRTLVAALISFYRACGKVFFKETRKPLYSQKADVKICQPARDPVQK